MAKKIRNIIVQVVVSIPRAGEFKVGIPIDPDLFLDSPGARNLSDVVTMDAFDRIRVKLDKGEHKRFVKIWESR